MMRHFNDKILSHDVTFSHHANFSKQKLVIEQINSAPLYKHGPRASHTWVRPCVTIDHLVDATHLLRHVAHEGQRPVKDTTTMESVHEAKSLKRTRGSDVYREAFNERNKCPICAARALHIPVLSPYFLRYILLQLLLRAASC